MPGMLPTGGLDQLSVHELETLLRERRGLDQLAEAERAAQKKAANGASMSDAMRRLQLLWRAMQGDHPQNYDLRTPAIQWEEEGMLAPRKPTGRIPGMPSPYHG